MEDKERLTRVEESTKSVHKRVDRLEKLLENNNKLVTNVEIIATEMKAMREDVSKIDIRVNAIEERPAKNWDNIIKTILGCIATAIATYFLTKMGVN